MLPSVSSDTPPVYGFVKFVGKQFVGPYSLFLVDIKEEKGILPLHFFLF